MANTAPPAPPNLTQRVASAAAWNTLLFPVQFVVGLLASVLLLNYLQPAEYGVLALLTGLSATIGLYADLGIERSLPRFIPEVEQREGRAGVARFLRRVIGLKLVLVIIAIVVLQLLSGPLLARVIGNEQAHLETANREIATLEAQSAPAEQRESAPESRRQDRGDQPVAGAGPALPVGRGRAGALRRDLRCLYGLPDCLF